MVELKKKTMISHPLVKIKEEKINMKKFLIRQKKKDEEKKKISKFEFPLRYKFPTYFQIT